MRTAFPKQTGMLAVAEVVPGGPGASELQSGDILVRVNGNLVSEFVPLESVLDDSVGETVVLDIQRGGRERTIELEVRGPARDHAGRIRRDRRYRHASPVLPAGPAF